MSPSLSCNLFNSAELTVAHTETAAVTHRFVNLYSAVSLLCKSGAADLQAHTALTAILGSASAHIGEFLPLDKSAGSLSDNNGKLVTVYAFLYNSFKLIENRIEFYQNSTKVSEMYAGSGYYRANMSTTTNGLYISSLLRVGGDLVCGKCLGISTGNGIYVSGKLALTMGQVKVQTNTAVQRYLLFYCGILVGIGSSKYSGISDYSASTY